MPASQRTWRPVVAIFAFACGGKPVPPPPSSPRIVEPPSTPTLITVERPTAANTGKPEPLLDLMSSELARSMAELAKHDDPPYFGAYTVTEQHQTFIGGAFGVLEHSSETRTRKLEVDFRIGDYKRDNTHAFASQPMLFMPLTKALPIDDDAYAIRTRLWSETDEAYKRARRALEYTAPKPTPDDPDDFSRAVAGEHIEAPVRMTIDRPAWEKRIAALSAALRSHPELSMASVTFAATDATRYYSNSEGTRTQVSETSASISIRIGFLQTSFDARSPDQLPDDETIRAKIDALIADATTLPTGPEIGEYEGPAIFEGDAGCLFFHDVFGELVEYRRDHKATLAFAKRIGSTVMPSFLDVYDDPTIEKLNGHDLAGFYWFDDEGVRAERATLVERGVLKGVLTSRSPLRGSSRSNGHGRAMEHHAPVARQANLVVAASRTVDRPTLRRMLLDEVKRQGKPYGIIVRRFVGVSVSEYGYGYSLGERFSLSPQYVVRLYPDGREELVRAASIDGDRLRALADITAASTDVDTFNWTSPPRFSASSPSVLVRRVHVSSGHDKPAQKTGGGAP